MPVSKSNHVDAPLPLDSRQARSGCFGPREVVQQRGCGLLEKRCTCANLFNAREAAEDRGFARAPTTFLRVRCCSAAGVGFGVFSAGVCERCWKKPLLSRPNSTKKSSSRATDQ